MTDQIKTACRAFVDEVVNRHELGDADRHVALDYVDHSTFPGTPPTRDGMCDSLRAVFAAFPDYRCEIESLVAEGDMVVARATGHGTMRGEFMGMPASGRDYRALEIHVCRYRDGKMVEHWGLLDTMSMMAQLGLAPQTATA